MIINYKKHRKAIEKLYDSVCTITRYKKEKDSTTKETKLVTEEPPVCVEQPCRISQKSLATNGQTEVQNSIRYEIKLFIAPEIEIRQGDEISVTCYGITSHYQAGEPFPPYPTHQEVSLQRKGKA